MTIQVTILTIKTKTTQPSCWTLYLLSNVDRANISNAKTGGLEADLALTSTQYSVVVLVFFTTYVACEIPSNLLLNRLRPSRYLPALAILWGAAAACQGAVSKWEHLAALRLVIGVFESGFAPGCAFYLSSWFVTFIYIYPYYTEGLLEVLPLLSLPPNRIQ